MDSLTRAFADSQRSYLSAKAATSRAVDTVLATGPAGGFLTNRPDLANAGEQLSHFKNWIYVSIRPIAQRIAAQPIHVAKKGGRKMGAKAAQLKPLGSHPLLDLLADPNDLMVSWSLMFSTVASMELTGRSLWWLPGAKQIYPIPTHWVRRINGASSISSFTVQPPYTGQAFDLPADECCYFAYPSPSDPHGAVSPLQAMAGAVHADEHMIRSQASMFERGVHPSHALVVGKRPHPDVPGGVAPRLSAEQQNQIISAIQRRYAGTYNHGQPLILDGLIEDVIKLSNTPAEMDWLNSGKTTKARIMQGFGVSPIIAGEIEGANRASATVADKHFIDFCVNPKIELISQTLTEWLAPMFGDDIVVWIEPCVSNDAEMGHKWADLLVRAGAVTGDELRSLSPFAGELKPGAFPDAVKPAAAGQEGKPSAEQDKTLADLTYRMHNLESMGVMQAGNAFAVKMMAGAYAEATKDRMNGKPKNGDRVG